MAILLSAGFFQSISRLAASEQPSVIRFVTELQQNPAHPGAQLHALASARSKDVWSGRVNDDIRVILHRDAGDLTLLHVDHHDRAYDWAERRDIERHQHTGMLQVVEVEELSKVVDRIIERRTDLAPRRFEGRGDDYLLSLGVPPQLMTAVREVRTDEQLLELVVLLPQDVGERLLDVADGKIVAPPPPVVPSTPPAQHPDARRSFYLVEDIHGLQAALNAPLAGWLAFLHPDQRRLAHGEFSGPVKVSGSAGTGKTVVLLHRARHLARQGQNVLVTSFVTTLCANLQRHLNLLCTPQELSRIRVATIGTEAVASLIRAGHSCRPPADKEVDDLLRKWSLLKGLTLPAPFVKAEWTSVILAQGIASWDEYRSARRTGRGRPLTVQERKQLWEVVAAVRDELLRSGKRPWPDIARLAAEALAAGQSVSGYDAVLVDEAQDLSTQEMRFVAALCRSAPGNLMVAGDAGQRIYPGGYSLRALGVDVRGRSHVLRINYRTTEQIRRFADRLLGEAVDDLDGGSEARRGTRSLLKGPEPSPRGFPTLEAEISAAVAEIGAHVRAGEPCTSLAVFTRTNKHAEAVRDALESANLPGQLLDNHTPDLPDAVHVGTMHRAKGLEFKRVYVLGCSSGLLPHPNALAGLDDPQDREAALAQERQLLYVALTRARDALWLSWHGSPSPFLTALGWS